MYNFHFMLVFRPFPNTNVPWFDHLIHVHMTVCRICIAHLPICCMCHYLFSQTEDCFQKEAIVDGLSHHFSEAEQNALNGPPPEPLLKTLQRCLFIHRILFLVNPICGNRQNWREVKSLKWRSSKRGCCGAGPVTEVGWVALALPHFGFHECLATLIPGPE